MAFITCWNGNRKEIIKVSVPYAIIHVWCYFVVHYRIEIIFIPDLSENMVLFLTGFVLFCFFSYFYRKLPLSLQLYSYFCWLSMLSFILTFPMKLTLIWIQMKTSRCNESIIKISSARTRLRRNTQSLHCETVNDAISCSPNSYESFAICASLLHSRSPK